MNIIKSNRRARQAGTTLVELSVVIAVILLLVSVLFIGINAWRNNANRAACLVNLASLQKAVRSYQNSNADDPTITTYSMAALTGNNGYFQAAPTCPQGAAAYTVNPATGGTFPAQGVVAFVCPNAGAPYNHAPTAASIVNW